MLTMYIGIAGLITSGVMLFIGFKAGESFNKNLK